MKKNKLFFNSILGIASLSIPVVMVTSCANEKIKNNVMGEKINEILLDSIYTFVNQDWTSNERLNLNERAENIKKLINSNLSSDITDSTVTNVEINLINNLNASNKNAIVSIIFDKEIQGTFVDFEKNGNVLILKSEIATGMKNFFEGTTLQVTDDILININNILNEKISKDWINDSYVPYVGLGTDKFDELIQYLNSNLPTGLPKISNISNNGNTFGTPQETTDYYKTVSLLLEFEPGSFENLEIISNNDLGWSVVDNFYLATPLYITNILETPNAQDINSILISSIRKNIDNSITSKTILDERLEIIKNETNTELAKLSINSFQISNVSYNEQITDGILYISIIVEFDKTIYANLTDFKIDSNNIQATTIESFQTGIKS